jgi:hypothetical protein
MRQSVPKSSAGRARLRRILNRREVGNLACEDRVCVVGKEPTAPGGAYLRERIGNVREGHDVGRTSQEKSAWGVIGVDDPLDRKEQVRSPLHLVDRETLAAGQKRSPCWQIGSQGAADWEPQGGRLGARVRQIGSANDRQEVR